MGTKKDNKKFNSKTAKIIAENSLGYVLDSVLGISDYDYTLGTDSDTFEQNFEEDLKEMGFRPTDIRINKCKIEFKKMINSIKKPMQKYYKHDLTS